MAAYPDRPTHRCSPSGCTHLVCEACHLPVCGPDDGWPMLDLAPFRFRVNAAVSTGQCLDYAADVSANARDHNAKWHAEWRRRWRANVLLIKAKLEFASGGDTTVEREFLPYMLTKGGVTLADWIESEAGERLLLGAG